MQCYECNTETGPLVQVVERWTVNGARETVSTCARHTACPECSDIMEINPISGRVECFTHGSVKDLIFISFTCVLNAWCAGYNMNRHYGPDNFPLTVNAHIGDARFIFSAQEHYVLSDDTIPMEVTWLNERKPYCYEIATEDDIDGPLVAYWRLLRARLLIANAQGRITWEHRSDYWTLAEQLRDLGHTVPQFQLNASEKSA